MAPITMRHKLLWFIEKVFLTPEPARAWCHRPVSPHYEDMAVPIRNTRHQSNSLWEL